MRLQDKVALITGGARGQGAAEARSFVAEGARVVIGDVLDDEGEAVAAELGEQCTYVHHDVGSESDWDSAVATAIEAYGKLDVLVNNAGIFGFTPIATTSAAEYMRIIEINQLGAFLGLRSAVRPMKRAGGGSIINVSSVMGLRGGPGMVAYASSKFAIRGMTKVAALELAGLHIRVNSVHPGVIDTPMLGEMIPLAGGRDEVSKTIPIKEMSQPEDVAHLVVFLASDESRHCTGSEFTVDGGVTCGLGAV